MNYLILKFQILILEPTCGLIINLVMNSETWARDQEVIAETSGLIRRSSIEGAVSIRGSHTKRSPWVLARMWAQVFVVGPESV